MTRTTERPPGQSSTSDPDLLIVTKLIVRPFGQVIANPICRAGYSRATKRRTVLVTKKTKRRMINMKCDVRRRAQGMQITTTMRRKEERKRNEKMSREEKNGPS